MRHRTSGRKLGRNSAHRSAMWRNMVTSLLEHGRIKTTEAKAKELRRHAEKTISKAIHHVAVASKPADQRTRDEQIEFLHAVRMAGRMVRTKDVLTRLFDVIVPALKDRPGGYTRIMKIAPRAGDCAPMVLIELIMPQVQAAEAA